LLVLKATLESEAISYIPGSWYSIHPQHSEKFIFGEQTDTELK